MGVDLLKLFSWEREKNLDHNLRELSVYQLIQLKYRLGAMFHEYAGLLSDDKGGNKMEFSYCVYKLTFFDKKIVSVLGEMNVVIV